MKNVPLLILVKLGILKFALKDKKKIEEEIYV